MDDFEAPRAPAGPPADEPMFDDYDDSPEGRRLASRARRAERSGGSRSRRPSGRRGRSATMVVWIVVAVVVLALLGVGGYLGYRAVAERAVAEGRLNDGLELLKKADVVVVRADQVIVGTSTAETAEIAAAAEKDLPGAVKDLQQAANLLAMARADLRPEDQQLADAGRASAQARLTMLQDAAPLLAANRKAAAALAPSEQAWTIMLEAAKLADQAVDQYNLRTEAGVKESDRITAQAQAKVTEARGLMSQAASAFPEAGLGLYVEYADDELKALAKSRETNAAWLKGDKTKANTLAKEFNKLENEASALAKNLAAPSGAIAKSFDLLVLDASATYQQARGKAAEADIKLNELTGR